MRPVLPHSTRRFVRAFLLGAPGRVASMSALLALAALLEGLGVLTLLPVFEAASGAADPSRLSQWLTAALDGLGLPQGLVTMLSLLVLAFVLKGAVYFFAMRQVGRMVADLGHALRVDAMRGILVANWSHVARTQPGHFAAAVSSEAQRASWGVLSLCNALAEALQILVYAALVVAVSPGAAVLMPLAVVFAMAALTPVVRASRSAGDRSTTHMRALVERLSEILPGLKAIRAMGLERESWPLLIREAEGFRQAQRRTVALREALSAIYEPVAALLLAVALWAGLVLGGMSVATLVLLAVLFQRMLGAASRVQAHLQSVLNNESAYNVLDDMIAEARDERAPEGGTAPAPPLTRAIRLRDLRFHHPDRAVLDGLDATIPAGRMTALVGPSGAGKTTLIDLLIGLRDPQSGVIEVDGTPLSPDNLAAWRRVCGYLPQDPLLFSDTIRRNLTLGAGGIPDETLMRACRVADIAALVDEAGGLDAPLAGHGGALSGGQRQRLCLARALAREPRFLILDEATSALDAATSARVAANLRGILDRTTILAVTHDPVLRDAADGVLRLEAGRLVAADGQAA
ncbi:ABC transporter ATP-binding protein [Citreimonas sp.]|uniref:ABC transporter ATP-binding protein n=1 Tax=Citreimonas sp. TaxID=3036715 RepID=UPI0040584529